MNPLLYKEYQTIGERIQALRGLLSITRKSFAKKHGIPAPTLRDCEHLKDHITDKQLKKILKAFEEEGVICPEEWLTKGIGPLPVFAKQLINQEVQSIESEAIAEEVNLNPILLELSVFRKYNPESFVLRITDNQMAPLYEVHDYVGGIKLPLPLDNQFYNKSHIITLPDDTHLVRVVYPGTEPYLFTLTCPAPFYKPNPPFLVNVPVKGIYRIVWHRKSE